MQIRSFYYWLTMKLFCIRDIILNILDVHVLAKISPKSFTISHFFTFAEELKMVKVERVFRLNKKDYIAWEKHN